MRKVCQQHFQVRPSHSLRLQYHAGVLFLSGRLSFYPRAQCLVSLRSQQPCLAATAILSATPSILSFSHIHVPFQSMFCFVLFIPSWHIKPTKRSKQLTMPKHERYTILIFILLKQFSPLPFNLATFKLLGHGYYRTRFVFFFPGHIFLNLMSLVFPVPFPPATLTPHLGLSQSLPN